MPTEPPARSAAFLPWAAAALALAPPGAARADTFYYELMPWVIDRGRTHDWVSTRLGLDGWPIIHRPFEHPRSGLIDSALGRDPLLRQDPCYGP